jgi:rubrerythrin
MAAEQSDTNEEKGALKNLAEEELTHIEYLKDLYQKVKNGNEAGLEITDLSPSDSPGVFTWENASREKGSLALSVFSIGIKMEKESIKFYEDAKEKTDLDQAEKLYDILIDWEYNHLRSFEKQYDMLKENWWHEQGFAPF